MSTEILRRPRFSPAALLHYWVAVTVAVGMAFPLAWLVYSSFKTNREITMSPLALPDALRWGHFVEAWQLGNLGQLYLNSLLVTGVSVTGLVLIASLAAYAFARLHFPGRDILFYTLLIGLLLPAQVVIIPLFFLLRDIGLLNTYWALILPYMGWPLALTVYLLRSYYLTLERELEDAARIDGANLIQTYLYVMFPLARPALATVIILNLVNLWNELLFAMLFIQDPDKLTLPAGLLAFSGHYIVDYRLVFAALSISTVPILVLYFIFQRHVISGLTTGALD